MPKHKLDEITLSIYGDEDSGCGQTYADADDSADECGLDDADGLERDWLEIMSGRVR